jgi:hypothetical protein
LKKSEQYRLWFSKLKTPENIIWYRCIPAIRTETSDDSYYLANLLDSISHSESEYLLSEISSAMRGGYFEEYYSVDQGSIDNIIHLVPPNLVLNNTFTISMKELKLLLVEWIEFCKT